MAEALQSADELNIDGFFRSQSAKSEPVASESEEDNPDTSKEAPDSKADKKSKKHADEDSDDDNDIEDDEDSGDSDDDSDEDEDFDDDDDSDEDEDLDDKKKKKKDVSKELAALKKQTENAEQQRAQMQSERDSYKAHFEKANSNIDSLTEKVEKLTKLTEKLTKKADQSDLPDFFTGDDEALMTEGQIKKILERQAKSSQKPDFDDVDKVMTEKEVKKLLKEQAESLKSEGQQQPKIGSNEEALKVWEDAQKKWATKQPDVEEVGNYYEEHKVTLDPELATIPSIDGRYIAVRTKRMEAELKTAKKALRKAKQKLKRMEKGELPETASGKRRNKPPASNDKPTGDPLVDFLSK